VYKVPSMYARNFSMCEAPSHFSVFLWSLLQDFLSGGLSHDATSLPVTETVHKSANGPLHNSWLL